jgi:hypothetical protein
VNKWAVDAAYLTTDSAKFDISFGSHLNVDYEFDCWQAPGTNSLHGIHNTSVPRRSGMGYTVGTTIYGDSLYGNLYVIPICYVESGI